MLIIIHNLESSPSFQAAERALSRLEERGTRRIDLHYTRRIWETKEFEPQIIQLLSQALRDSPLRLDDLDVTMVDDLNSYRVKISGSEIWRREWFGEKTLYP